MSYANLALDYQKSTSNLDGIWLQLGGHRNVQTIEFQFISKYFNRLANGNNKQNVEFKFNVIAATRQAADSRQQTNANGLGRFSFELGTCSSELRARPGQGTQVIA